MLQTYLFSMQVYSRERRKIKLVHPEKYRIVNAEVDCTT